MSDENQIIVIQDEKGSLVQFSHNQVKPYLPESVDINYIKSLRSALLPYMSDNSPDPPTVHFTEIIASTDSRARSPEMFLAIYDEVKDLIRRGASKVSLRHKLPDGVNALRARFALAIK